MFISAAQNHQEIEQQQLQKAVDGVINFNYSVWKCDI